MTDRRRGGERERGRKKLNEGKKLKERNKEITNEWMDGWIDESLQSINSILKERKQTILFMDSE